MRLLRINLGDVAMIKSIFTPVAFLLLCAFCATNAFAQQSTKKIDYCQKGRFKPCVCWQDVSKDVSYRVSYKGCGGKAAILTRGKYKNIFSVVVRDKDNRDRWPASGFNGCSAAEAQSVSPPASCSAFKVQEIYYEETPKGTQRVNCLGAKGTSSLFKNVVRMTAKISDKPGTTNDPLARWCLRSPRKNLN